MASKRPRSSPARWSFARLVETSCLAAVGALSNETGALEYRDVFLHGGKAHVVPRGQIGDDGVPFSERARMSRRVPSASARNNWFRRRRSPV
jgi:hypothetical protein